MTADPTPADLEAYLAAPPVNPAGMPTPYEHGGRLTAEGTTVDPVLVEIVQGSLASVEREVETAIAQPVRNSPRMHVE